eukprot:16517-Eustigmatos_ZCMA.PRE.1
MTGTFLFLWHRCARLTLDDDGPSGRHRETKHVHFYKRMGTTQGASSSQQEFKNLELLTRDRASVSANLRFQCMETLGEPRKTRSHKGCGHA